MHSELQRSNEAKRAMAATRLEVPHRNGAWKITKCKTCIVFIQLQFPFSKDAEQTLFLFDNAQDLLLHMTTDMRLKNASIRLT